MSGGWGEDMLGRLPCGGVTVAASASRHGHGLSRNRRVAPVAPPRAGLLPGDA